MPQIQNYSYNEMQQAKLASTLSKALSVHKRLSVIRVDCRFPNLIENVSHTNLAEPYSDSVISRFVASLKSKLKADLIRKEATWKRRLHNELHYVWVREIGPKSAKPHYHLMLFVNKDVYHSLGDYTVGSGTLAGMIREAWCSALGLPIQQFACLASFPASPMTYVDANSQELERQIYIVLQRGSYLCKEYSKQPEAGYRAFGTSRLALA